MIIANTTIPFGWFLFIFETKAFINSKLFQHDIGVVSTVTVCCSVYFYTIDAFVRSFIREFDFFNSNDNDFIVNEKTGDSKINFYLCSVLKKILIF